MSNTTATAALTARQREVLAAARKAGVEQENGGTYFTARDVATELGVKPQAVTSILTSLVKRGEIKKKATSGVYALPPVVTVVEPSDTVALPEDALHVARELVNAEAAFQTTKAGSHGKVVTVGDAYVTTDGRHLTAKVGADPKLPWILVNVPDMRVVGYFKSSSASTTLEALGAAS